MPILLAMLTSDVLQASAVRYDEIHDLAARLEAVAEAENNRLARLKSLRIWRARRRWGGFPTEKNWEALVAAGKDAEAWLVNREPCSHAEATCLEDASLSKEYQSTAGS